MATAATSAPPPRAHQSTVFPTSRWFRNSCAVVGVLFILAGVVTGFIAVQMGNAPPAVPVQYYPVTLAARVLRTVQTDAPLSVACASVPRKVPLCVTVYADAQCAMETCHPCNVTQPDEVSAWKYRQDGNAVCVPPQSALPRRSTPAHITQLILLVTAGVCVMVGLTVFSYGCYFQFVHLDATHIGTGRRRRARTDDPPSHTTIHMEPHAVPYSRNIRFRATGAGAAPWVDTQDSDTSSESPPVLPMESGIWEE